MTSRGKMASSQVPAFPDTSFLWALYHLRATSMAAIDWLRRSSRPLPLSEALQFEFIHSVQRAIFLGQHRDPNGISAAEGAGMLVDFEAALEAGTLWIVECDWTRSFAIAARLSEKHAVAHGGRSFDILHVATALHLGAREFLTFEAPQRRLAEAEGLIVPL